jgi:hypothetical protein
MKHKKGAELTIGTIVIIVLALVVLVVLVVGFTSGWGNLWTRITSFFGGGNNVDSVIQACQVACTTGAQYDYCTRERTVKYEQGDEQKEITKSCDSLAKENEDLGFETCDNTEIKCGSSEDDDT